jgi:exodeoxyribonuclease V alpha subunit
VNVPLDIRCLLLRVKSIRSADPKGFGGCIFSADEVDEAGAVKNGTAYFVVKAPHFLLNGARVERGQWWSVAGSLEKRALTVNGYRLTEWQILPRSMQLARPSGEHIVRFLADCDAFAGIGEVKARRLWERFGEELFGLLDRGDGRTLADVLTPEMAATLVEAWREIGQSETLQWLQAHGFTIEIGQKLIRAFGPEAPLKIEEDPYRLLSFCARWPKVDALARDEFDLPTDDPRRLQGAMEEALYRLWDDGHTCAPREQVIERMKPLLGTETGADWRALAERSFSAGQSNGSYILRGAAVHPVGAFVMEREVARVIGDALARPAPLVPERETPALLACYETRERIELNERQREAVSLANRHAFLAITGGAGVGKTTVLKAVLTLCERAGVGVHQLALSGRAAKRIREATDRSAMTIAAFVRNVSENELKAPSVIVIDEASMVDIPSMYRLSRKLSEQVRLVLVGDSYQLPPVGPGLTLHELVRTDPVPVVELTEIRRHGGAIAAFAQALRHGEWPADVPADPQAPVAFLRCPIAEINPTILGLYSQNPAGSQILSPTRNSPYGGNRVINQLCQSALGGNAKELMVWNAEHDMREGTGLRLGDSVICTRNRWDEDLQNGSLGRLEAVEDCPCGAPDGDDPILGWVRWDDGEQRPVTASALDDLDLAYSITVHKSQGSEFPRVIVPITPNRILDRTLIYTAVTRAQLQVLLVGDEKAARKAVAAPPKAQLRQVALGTLLQEILGS